MWTPEYLKAVPPQVIPMYSQRWKPLQTSCILTIVYKWCYECLRWKDIKRVMLSSALLWKEDWERELTGLADRRGEVEV